MTVAPSTENAKAALFDPLAPEPGLEQRCWQARVRRDGARVVLAGDFDGASARLSFAAPAAFLVAALVVVLAVAVIA